MKINLEPGKYVVGVSGGVDSMVLLNMLSKLLGVEIIVAHFDHGIRADSALDAKLVAKAAKAYGMTHESARGKLGANASEDTARTARYKFLESVRAKHNAAEIITAHHQDDLIETALLNLLRGSGRQGLVAMPLNKKITRPLLNIPKKDLLDYAQKNNIEWREDSTNQDVNYLRNYVRLNLIPKLTKQQRQDLLNNLDKLLQNHSLMNDLLTKLSDQISVGGKIDRQKFITLPLNLANELIVFWFKQLGLKDFDKKMVARVAMQIKTAQPATTHQIKNGLSLVVDKHFAVITNTLA